MKYKYISPLQAIEAITDTKHFLFRVDRLPKELIEFIDLYSKSNSRHRSVNAFDSFLHYTQEYDKYCKLSDVHQIKTEYIAIKAIILQKFYGVKNFNVIYYGLRNRTNRKRLLHVNDNIHVTRLKDIINVCSAGLWELRYMGDTRGYHIQSDTALFDNPLDTIEKNQYIANNISLVANLNSIYWRSNQ